MNPPPSRIGTARLTLRHPQVDDAEAIFEEYAADPQVTRFLAFRTHTEIEPIRAFLRETLEAMEHGKRFAWGITLIGSDRLIGMFDLRIDGPRAEFGYVLAKRHWGQGYMPEAIRPVLDWALAQEEIHRVWAVCDAENKASARVLEKLGMEREGILRKWFVHPNISPVPRDCYSYSIVRP
jgi:ribosomal-protein-alanine N-acetyltransferase